jgi:hypothetical protein
MESALARVSREMRHTSTNKKHSREVNRNIHAIENEKFVRTRHITLTSDPKTLCFALDQAFLAERLQGHHYVLFQSCRPRQS